MMNYGGQPIICLLECAINYNDFITDCLQLLLAYPMLKQKFFLFFFVFLKSEITFQYVVAWVTTVEYLEF